MLKREFIELLESIVQGSREVFNNDKPAIRQLFNDTKDMYHKEGQLTDNQCQNWILLDRELNKLLRLAK